MNAPRAAVIANPVKVDVPILRAALRTVEQDLGWEPSLLLETTVDEDADVRAREALASDVDLVVAAGGDGTVRLVAGELHGQEVPLGIVPAGTGNLLARNLRIDPTLSLTERLHIAFAGKDRRVDLGRAVVERPDGTKERFPFAVLAGVGVDAGMIEHTDDKLKARIGWPAYFGGMFRALAGGPTFRARFRVDGGRTYGVRAAGFMVGNCGMLQGGMRLLPDAEIDDGILDTLVLRPSGPLGWLEVFAGIVTGALTRVAPTHIRSRLRGLVRALNYLRSTDVVLRIDSHPEPFEVDGDAVGEIIAAHITVHAGAVTVRVPR